MALRRKDQSLMRFLSCFKKPTSRLFMSMSVALVKKSFFYAYCAIVDSFVIVSFILEKHYIPQYYRWLTCYVCAKLCQCFGQGGCYFRCDKPCTCNYICIQCFLLLRSCGHILTPPVNLAFRPKSASKITVRFGPCSGSGRVQASKWGPFTTLCGYVGRGQQGEIERIHTPPTNSKDRLKSFCKVGFANFRPNVFAAGKRISMEILVRVGLHAWCPVAFKSDV